MKKIIAWCAVAGIVLLLPTAGFAASPWTQEPTYQAKTAAKFVFGVKNMLFGWTEIFTQCADSKAAGVKCPVTGFGKGLWNAVGQTAGGAIHTATFFIPIDVPLPENGTQFVK